MSDTISAGPANTLHDVMVVGIGGIGGLMSAPLVGAFGSRIHLVETGPRKVALLRHGLTIASDVFGHVTVQPADVTDRPQELPHCDVVLVCVKNPSLPSVIDSLRGCVDESTVIVPIMNGVQAYGRLAEAFPEACVLPAAIYVVSYVQDDGTVVHKGDLCTVYVGPASENDNDAQAASEVARLLGDAGIDCRVSADIEAEVWHKYILNCAYNVVDTRWDCTTGDILRDHAKLSDFWLLMEECAALARARGVHIDPDIVRHNMDKLMHATSDSTTSLHRDFKAGYVGELEVFSGDVVRMARGAGVPVPVSVRYYEALQEISAGFIRP